jgi:hypothetical protein
MARAARQANHVDDPAGGEHRRITQDDLEAKFRELVEDVRGEASSAKSTIAAVGIVLAAIVLLIAFLLGRRGGRKRTTIVEIRRV